MGKGRLRRSEAVLSDRVEQQYRRETAELITLGQRYYNSGQYPEAVACCRRALQRDPENPEVWNALSNIFRRIGKYREALACMARVVCLSPAHPALANMAQIFSSIGNRSMAVKWAMRSVRCDPLQALSWNTLGNAWRADRQYAMAIVAWSHALTIAPDLADAHGNLAGLLRDMEHPVQAEQAARRALRLNPMHAGLLNSLVHILQGQDRSAEALRACRAALVLAPAFADAWCNMGLIEQQQGDKTSAASRFARAVTLDPGHALARFNRGLLDLERGGLATGWSGYSYRFAAGQARPVRHFAIPQWQGEDLTGKRLFIWREQGVGDEFLFASCYADAIRHAGHQAGTVVIECDRRLTSLFARSFPTAVVRAEQRAVPGLVERVDCDYHIPAGSLPGLLRRNLASFAGGEGWLQADPNRAALWRDCLLSLHPGLRVGIAWRSMLTTLTRRGSYLPLDAWGPIFAVPGVVLINLQHGDCLAEIAAAERLFKTPIRVAPNLDLRDDFEGTAALISTLDLVIAPAVSIAELAGALGVPVWRFAQRDWTTLGTGTRPFMPSMRTFSPRAGQPLSQSLITIAEALSQAARRCAPEAVPARGGQAFNAVVL